MIQSRTNAACGLALVAVAALAACSGSGSNAVMPSVGEKGGFARTTFVVHWPSSQQSLTARRRRDTLSPSTASIVVAVNGGAPTVVNKPTLSGSPTSTSVTIDAPVGTDSFSFLAYDLPGGTGNVLDQAQISQSIVANTNNTVAVTLDGVCAALLANVTASTYAQTHPVSATLPTGATKSLMSSLRIVGPFAQTVTITEADADGNTIVNSAGAVPIILTASGATPPVTIAPVSTSAGNASFTLTPTAAEPDGVFTTITASSPNCGNGTTTFPNSFSLSTSALVYVADSVAGVLAFDQDGKQLAKIASTTGITGFAYNSKSASFVTVEPASSTSGGIKFQTFSTTGSSLGSGTLSVSSSLKNPVGNIAYNPANGNFLVAMREYTDSSSTQHYGTVLEYTIAASTGTSVKPSGTNPFQTSSSTPPPYDPNSFAVFGNGDVIVGDADTDSYFFDENGNYLNTNIGAATSTLVVDTLRNDVEESIDAGQGYTYNQTGTALNYISEFYFPDASSYVTAAAYSQGADELFGFTSTGSGAISGSTLSAYSTATMNLLPPGAFASLTAPTEAVALP